MRFIGITGGWEQENLPYLHILRQKPGIRVMLADEIAHDLMQPGTECFQKLKRKICRGRYLPAGRIVDRAQLCSCHLFPMTGKEKN